MKQSTKAAAKKPAKVKTPAPEAEENKSIAIPIDIKKSFEKLASLEEAAKKIKENRNEGTIRAYILVIGHLHANNSGFGKRDKVAKDTFEALVQLGISNAKARRFIELSQAYRRSDDMPESGTINDIAGVLTQLEIDSESALRNHLFPKDNSIDSWIKSCIKKVSKDQKQMFLVKGETATRDEIRLLFEGITTDIIKNLIQGNKGPKSEEKQGNLEI